MHNERMLLIGAAFVGMTFAVCVVLYWVSMTIFGNPMHLLWLMLLCIASPLSLFGAIWYRSRQLEPRRFR